MNKKLLSLSAALAMVMTAGVQAKTQFNEARHMWASINNYIDREMSEA